MGAVSIVPTDLSSTLLHLAPDGAIETIAPGGRGHPNVEGRLAGEARMSKSPPHGGEMHPNGDELLYLVEGKVSIALDEDGKETVVTLGPGHALVVPRGVWHRVIVKEPCRLLFFTPGESQVRSRRA